MRILVTGGVRSGKSMHAEALLANALEVVYIAPGSRADGSDPDWDSRVARHRARRPATWLTIETADVATALSDIRCPVLVDCLGTWLTALMDREALWNTATAEAHLAVEEPLDKLCAALAVLADAIVVTNEVGLGVVPAHRSGMLFRDLLGTINQRVANVCHEVHLLIAGRVLTL
ncbi:bifunctional adenosylcobinamide kinase/adenosylcobinamide-phosphate guanylyltransferase [Mycobacterium attenuatum]|uniref:bifunctional adenosylcobinamide kinase/adenosylcobinamide-phosphate guanylyltransferase n=1 Tax=Mycobacterium attenuatum TaxID=2341086 RepID=UPI000F03ABF3|nr:bifunctional adenosylcobinamide kinase/adenosylcobinamide-phosphate guanylyltransferase [Mycobacterium attenuatum]VBA52240.1 Bifunctional adenosylcobalamin biosynthesis protein CobU [Mycobacterium attenuatum]